MRRLVLFLALSGAAVAQTIDWHDLVGKDAEIKAQFLLTHRHAHWVYVEGKGWHRKHHIENLTLDEAYALQDAKDTPICRWCIEDDMKGSFTLFGALKKVL